MPNDAIRYDTGHGITLGLGLCTGFIVFATLLNPPPARAPHANPPNTQPPTARDTDPDTLAAVPTNGREVNIARLMHAIAIVESSGHNRAPYVDCGSRGKAKGHRHTRDCYAWGLYAFHPARWSELSDARWGTSGITAQHAAMRLCITRVLRKVPSDADPVVWIANYHNLGHGSSVVTSYVKKALTEYERD